jgi:hypothetical protein
MDALLVELCIKHGWCLTPADHDALVMGGTGGSESIVRQILAAEFGEDHIVDGRTRMWLEGLVDDWLFDPHGRGAGSGLPR